MDQAQINFEALGDKLQLLTQNLGQVIRGAEGSIRLLFAAYLSGGHVLLEDVPGTGKTTLAKSLAKLLGGGFSRIQFTPDLLPSDIVGVSIYNPSDKEFKFHPGPIFTQFLLADEINRASPRTQSALLEAMAEKQVTADGRLMPLDSRFFVIATQNPIEYQGTYPLPEAQMDRFSLCFKLGYLSHEDEVRLLDDQLVASPLDKVTTQPEPDLIEKLHQGTRHVAVHPSIKSYIVDIVAATRTHPKVRLGASPRASIGICRMAQCLALYDKSAFVTPDHVQELAAPALSHRIMLGSEAKYQGEAQNHLIAEILEQVPVPS